MTDEELLTKYLETKDHELFTILYERMQPRLYRLSLRILKSPEDAEDIIQDTFSKLLELKAPAEPIRSAESFLFRITQNLCLDRKRSEETDVLSSASTIDTLVDSGMTDDNLLHRQSGASNLPDKDSVLTECEARALGLQTEAKVALESLPPNQKDAIELYHCRGMTAAEAAELLHVSQTTIEKRAENGIAKLRKVLGVTTRPRIRPVKATNSNGEVIHEFPRFADAISAGFNKEGIYRSIRRGELYKNLKWAYATAV
jgi:RNA polymerase sigma-70 factor (ECF subfamily)